MRRDTRGGEGQALHVYHLRINQVKMKVKFQCKMKIDYNNQPITLEVPHIGSNIYTFNQDITLAEDSTAENCFTLSINLVTSKGAKYIAALAYLHHSQLIRAADTGVGSKLSIPLSKCLDPQAAMEVIVKEAVSTGARAQKSRNTSISRNRKRINTQVELNLKQKSYVHDNNYQQAQISPRGKSISGLGLGTRSQVNLAPSNYNLRTQRYKERSRSRHHLGRDSAQKPHGMLSSRQSLGHLLQTHSKNFIHDQNTEQEVGYMLRDRDNSYSKIRQRLRKQELHAMKEHEKRMNLENSENNAKLETLKYKLRCQQFQKNLQDKNSNIHTLENRIDELERLLRSNPQQNTLGTFQMIESPKHNSSESEALISMLENKVSSANQQLQELRVKVSKLSRNHSERQLGLSKELESKKITIKNLQNQLNSLTTASMTWKNNSQQCHELSISIQSKNKYITELQRDIKQCNNKISELQKGKRVLEQNNHELVSKLENTIRMHAAIDNQKTRMIENMETYKSKNNMAQFTIGSLKKTIEKLEGDLGVAIKFRQKYNQCQVELKRIEGQKKFEIRNFQNSLKIVNGNLVSLQQKYNQDIDILNRKTQDLESKVMTSNIRNKQLENTIIPSLKNQIQQGKRIQERAQRQCQDYKSSDRSSKREIQTLQAKLNQITGEMEMYKNKFRSLESIHKVEADKYSSESKRIRESLEQQVMKNLSLNEKYQGMATQHGIMSSKLSHIEDRYQKQTKQLAEKLDREIKKNRDLQDSLKKKQQSYLEYVEKEKKLVSKIEEYGENQGEYSQLIRRYERQVSKWQSQCKSCQQKLNSKLEQLKKIDQGYKELTRKYEESYRQLQESTFENKSLSSDLAKLQKQYDQIQYYLAQSKAALENKQKAIQKMKGSIQQQSKTKTNVKEELMKMEMNYENLNKDYERFREHLYGTLMREFSGVDGLEGLLHENAHQLKDSASDRTIYGYTNNNDNNGSSPRIRRNNYSSQQHGFLPTSASTTALNNTDIISTINQFSKQSKMMISKLVDECRQMQKELQKIRENSEQIIAKQENEINNKNELIHKLEEELQQNYDEKKLTEGELMKRILNLEKEIQKLIEEIEKKQTENEQLQFALSGVNMEKESEKQYYETTINEHQNVIMRLEKNLQHLHVKYTQMETHANQLSAQLQQTSSQLEHHKQKLTLQQKSNRQKQSDIAILNKNLEENKTKNKSLLAQIAELQMLLTNEKERNNKNVELIEQQEKKLTDTKDFMNNIIKQKETIVKQQIQNTQKIIQLQGAISHLKFTLEDLTDKLSEANKKNIQQKDANKKLNLKIKTSEQDQFLLQQNINKLQSKLKEKQQQLSSTNEKLNNIMDQYSKDNEKKIKQIENYKQEIDINTRLTSQEIDNYKKQIAKLEEEVLAKVKEQLKVTKCNLQNANRELENSKKQIQQQSFQNHSLKDQLQTAYKQRQKLELDIEKLMDQLRSKDEQMYEISGQLYTFEQRYHEKVLSNEREFQKFEEQFGYKYEAMVEDYQTKLDQIQKQRDYFKNKLNFAEEQLTKLNSRLTSMEYEDNQIRLMSQDKLIKSEEEKNSVVLGLKNQLKKALQAKQKNEQEIKKVKLELQNIKSQTKSDRHIIDKYEKKSKQNEEKIQNLQNQLQKESQKQKKLEMGSKQLQQSIHNYQWGLEREVKKQLQNLTKSIMVSLGGENQSKRRIMDSVKDVETRIIRVVGEQIPPSTLK